MPTAGWWETLWPKPARRARGCRPQTQHGRNRSLLRGWLVHLGNGEGRPPRGRNRHRPQYVGRGAGSPHARPARRIASSWKATPTNSPRLCVGSADFVFMANAFHGVPDQPRLAQAIHKTLKPGGRFAVVNWHQRPREETTILGEPRGPKTELRMSPEQTIKSIEAGGLIFAELVELPPYHYAVIFDRSSSVRPPV